MLDVTDNCDNSSTISCLQLDIPHQTIEPEFRLLIMPLIPTSPAGENALFYASATILEIHIYN